MRLPHLRPGRGSTSGLQEDTLGLLGEPKREQKAAGEHRAASSPKGQEFTPGVYPKSLPRGFIFLQPLCSQGDRPSSGKLEGIEQGHDQISSEHILPCVGAETAPSSSPQQKPQQTNPNPRALSAALTAWLCKPPKPSKPQTLTTVGDATLPLKSCCSLVWLKLQQEVPESSSSELGWAKGAPADKHLAWRGSLGAAPWDPQMTSPDPWAISFTPPFRDT